MLYVSSSRMCTGLSQTADVFIAPQEYFRKYIRSAHYFLGRTAHNNTHHNTHMIRIMVLVRPFCTCLSGRQAHLRLPAGKTDCVKAKTLYHGGTLCLEN